MLSVSGCRGVVGGSLTPATAARFVGAFALGLARGGGCPVVVVGRDGRRGGGALERVVCGSLASAGCDVVSLGVATTPTVGHAVLARGAAGGVVVTASHNPGEWNGLKAVTSLGGAPSPEEARALIARFEGSEAVWAGSGGVGRIEEGGGAAGVAHVEAVLGALADHDAGALEAVRRRGCSVLVDSVNGSGAGVAGLLLERMGCVVEHVHAEGTGVFPHPPEPTAAHLSGVSPLVRERGCAAGFVQDPDADRLALIDESGRFVGEEYTLALSAWSWLASLGADARGAVLAANLSTSRMIDDVAGWFGARVVRTAVGEANVVSGMRRVGAVLGGEGNGGVIWLPVVPIRDSLAAMALVLALMAREGCSLSALVSAVPGYAIEKRKAAADGALMDRAAGVLRGVFGGASVDEQDGVRLDFSVDGGDADGGRAWLHVRASNTEPIVRLIAEAPSPALAAEVLDRASAALGL